tara:strand:+ start:339 stop:758 length:420 start_codon:yes stop_codon:yes gene_type:complete
MQTVAMEKAIKNDMWVSNEDLPLPKVLPELPGFNILVRPVSIKSQTKGGIFIPDSTKDDMAYLTTVGEVIILGDVAYQDKEKFPKGPWCKVGDYICYGKHSGQKIQYKGLKFILLYDDQIIMKVENPKTLDPTFNLSKH